MQLDPSSKVCAGCKQTKTIEEFGSRRDQQDGRNYECKQCLNERMRQWRMDNPERWREICNASNKRWYARNPEYHRSEEVKHKAKERANRYYQTAVGQEKKRENTLRRHGITPRKYAAILEAQNGGCAICGKTETTMGNSGRAWELSIDHDHKCCSKERSCGRCIRGLLCSSCNRGLGAFLDDPKLLKNAIQYLSKGGTMPETPIKNPLVALYARVSTTDQDCTMQLDEMRSFAERRGWLVSAEYVDTGWSGATRDRPQLTKLMKDARMRRFDIVICWKVDRFGRSVANFVESLQNLDSWGIRFLVITQSIDTDTSNPSSRLLLQILAAVAEFERSMIAERVKAGLKAAKKRGIQLGRREIIIDKVKVREMHLRGKSVRQIAAEMKVSHTKIHNIVKAAAA